MLMPCQILFAIDCLLDVIADCLRLFITMIFAAYGCRLFRRRAFISATRDMFYIFHGYAPVFRYLMLIRCFRRRRYYAIFFHAAALIAIYYYDEPRAAVTRCLRLIRHARHLRRLSYAMPMLHAVIAAIRQLFAT